MDKAILRAELVEQIDFKHYRIKANFVYKNKTYNSEQIARICDLDEFMNGDFMIVTLLNPFDALILKLNKAFNYVLWDVKDECKKTFTVGLMGRL